MKKKTTTKQKQMKMKTNAPLKENKSSSKKAQYAPPSELNLQITPWVLGLIAAFFLLCMFLPASSGWLGHAFQSFFGGLFSYGAYLIPTLILARAVFYRKEALTRYPGTNWWLSVIFLCVFACLLASIKCDVTGFNPKAHFDAAFVDKHILTTNSLVGGIISNALIKLVGKPFTIVIAIVSIFVITPFLVSKTPLDVIRFIARSIRDGRKDSKIRREERQKYYDEKEKKAEKEKEVELPKKKEKRVDLEELHEENPLLEEENFEEEDDTDKDITDTHVVDITEPEKTTLEKVFAETCDPDAYKTFDPDVVNDFEECASETVIGADDEIHDVVFEDEKTDIPVTAESDIPEYEYRFPPVELLKKGEGITSSMAQEYEQTAKKLVDTLTSFGVRTRIVNIAKGPTVTRYELQPETGVRVRTIRNLSDDISLSLASKGVRIEAPIPGKEAVGIEVPNKNTSIVSIRELIEAKTFDDSKSKLTACLGVDVAGNPVYCDIAKMPHILIAGTTGSGKSVCINSLLVSFLYKSTPEEVKFILIDPKKIELGVYNGIPHLLVPVVSDPKKAAGALAWAVGEMERRFALIEEVGVRDIRSYNEVAKLEEGRETLPRIVIVIDELADLMMMARDNVESSICRIAQKARAAGMHLVIGTQRPSVDVITGLIKANVPSRIAFTVASQVDSKTILDMAGAEKLIGRGDMLYAPVGAMTPTRVQGSFVSDNEIEAIIDFLKDNSSSSYNDEVIEGIEREAEKCLDKGRGKSLDDEMGSDEDGEGSLSSDPMLKPAIEIALDSGTISTSMLQRRLKLGYARAARLIDKMEALGVVSEFAGSKPRTVLISREKYTEMLLNSEE